MTQETELLRSIEVIDLSALTISQWNEGATQAAIVIRTDPPSVWVADHLAWDQAARLFWNAVARVNSQPAPFPDAD